MTIRVYTYIYTSTRLYVATPISTRLCIYMSAERRATQKASYVKGYVKGELRKKAEIGLGLTFNMAD